MTQSKEPSFALTASIFANGGSVQKSCRTFCTISVRAARTWGLIGYLS